MKNKNKKHFLFFLKFEIFLPVVPFLPTVDILGSRRHDKYWTRSAFFLAFCPHFGRISHIWRSHTFSFFPVLSYVFRLRLLLPTIPMRNKGEIEVAFPLRWRSILNWTQTVLPLKYVIPSTQNSALSQSALSLSLFFNMRSLPKYLPFQIALHLKLRSISNCAPFQTAPLSKMRCLSSFFNSPIFCAPSKALSLSLRSLDYSFLALPFMFWNLSSSLLRKPMVISNLNIKLTVENLNLNIWKVLIYEKCWEDSWNINGLSLTFSHPFCSGKMVVKK